MSAPATSVLVIVAVLCVVGVTLLAITSARLRSEIQDLLRTFDRTERTLVPLVVTVRTDRERLAERLEHLTDPGRPRRSGSHSQR